MVVLDDLALLIAVIGRDRAISAERNPLRESVECLALVGCRLDQGAQLRAAQVLQQELGADGTSQLSKCLVEPVLFTVSAQLAQQRRGSHASRFNREHDPQHIGQMGLDQMPVYRIREQRVNMGEGCLLVRAIHRQVFPVADARHQGDSQQRRQAKDRCALRLGIALDRIGLNVGEVLEQAVEKINRLPDPAGDEVGEQGDVGVGDMIVANAAIPSVADVVLGEQVLLVQIPFCAVGYRLYGSTTRTIPYPWSLSRRSAV